jgi:hypothetical protein
VRSASPNGPPSRRKTGGAERLAEWAAESPENEATFWRHIYQRLLPSSVNVLALQQQWDALLRPASQEEIVQRVEQRVGPEGCRLFEGWWAKVKRLSGKMVCQPVPPCSKIKPPALSAEACCG